MSRSFLSLAAMAALVSMSAQSTVAPSSGINKDMNINTTAVRQSRKKALLSADGSNPRKHIRTPKINQRQKRKYLRQNPHYRRCQ